MAFAAAILQMVASAIASIPSAAMRTTPYDPRITHAYQIMNQRLDRRLSNTELARLLNVSEATLLRMFREVGAPPQKEHLRIRLNHAAALLQHSTKTIKQVADECGFCDRNYFTRVFTREWRISPAQYRNCPTQL